MAGRIFVIGDTHFGHVNILKYEPLRRRFATIEEHDEFLIDRWNSVVGKRDVVWHVGDVLFGKHNFQLLSRLQGIKKLVLGNHDHYPLPLYLEHFSKIQAIAVVREHVLSHVPIHPQQLYRFQGNVHGHMHSRGHIDNDRYYNVSAEMIDFTPRLFNQVVGR